MQLEKMQDVNSIQMKILYETEEDAAYIARRHQMSLHEFRDKSAAMFTKFRKEQQDLKQYVLKYKKTLQDALSSIIILHGDRLQDKNALMARVIAAESELKKLQELTDDERKKKAQDMEEMYLHYTKKCQTLERERDEMIQLNKESQKRFRDLDDRWNLDKHDHSSALSDMRISFESALANSENSRTESDRRLQECLAKNEELREELLQQVNQLRILQSEKDRSSARERNKELEHQARMRQLEEQVQRLEMQHLESNVKANMRLKTPMHSFETHEQQEDAVALELETLRNSFAELKTLGLEYARALRYREKELKEVKEKLQEYQKRHPENPS
eukprot:TRINITY_DN8342_c0_g1_i1.p1 TRINITY_DN8342_c0_g1~~TRINITY_DN8342_c0_g1_i1.p1  ORF type:complete len:332 (-),score=101.93 TRINITY_DN8342_c0_g1_i1:417-1412(-)